MFNTICNVFIQASTDKRQSIELGSKGCAPEVGRITECGVSESDAARRVMELSAAGADRLSADTSVVSKYKRLPQQCMHCWKLKPLQCNKYDLLQPPPQGRTMVSDTVKPML